MYRCPKHYTALKACDNQRSISEAKLERYLLDHVQELLKDYIAKQEAQTGKPKDNSKRIKALEKKIARLKDLYVEELISLEEYKADKEKYLVEIAGLQSAPQPLQNAQKQLLEMDLESYYTNLTQEQKRGFWRSIIREIRFDRERNITVIFL
jgi:ribosomal protein L29